MIYAAYIKCYAYGAVLGFKQCRALGADRRNSFKNAVKSANLSVCFLGFARNGSVNPERRSSEIASLAATFDYVTDVTDYSRSTIIGFHGIAEELLSADAYTKLTELLELKKRKAFKKAGLERGVWALELIEMHVSREAPKLDLDYLQRVGINCQVADDILDAKSDFETEHLNFLKLENADTYLRDFAAWDWSCEFSDCPNSAALRLVLRRAERECGQLLEKRMRSMAIQAKRSATSQASIEL